MDFPEHVNTSKKIGTKKKGSRPRVNPAKFYPSQVELQTQELLHAELGEYAKKLQDASQEGGVQGVYGVLGAVPDWFREQAEKLAESVSLFQIKAFADYSNLVVGERYFPTQGDRDIILATWTENFVNLCKSTNEEMRKKIAGVISDGVLSGRNIKSVTMDIQNTCKEFSRSKAELIATTEVGKLNTAISRNQSESSGIDYYEWSAAMDGRTRESHAVMDGKICKWGDDRHYYAWEDDPAKPGKRKLVRKPRPGNAYMGAPGTDFRCRCVALPYIPEYEDDYEEERPKGKVQGVTQEHPAETAPSEQTLELERRLEMSRKADARHAARTEEQRNAVIAKWNEREKKRRIAKAAEMRHAERNEEAIRAEMQKRIETRKKARELLSQMSGIYGVDTEKLRQAIGSGNTKKIESEMKPLIKTKKEIESLGDRIDNPLEAAKKYGLSRTKNAIEAADKTIASWGSVSPEEKKTKLEHEIAWVEKTKKYAAWELSRDIYRKELGKVENEIKWNEIESQAKELAEIKKNLPKANAEFTKLMAAVEKASKGDRHSDKDLDKYRKAVEKARKKAEKFQTEGASFDKSCFTAERKNKALFGVGSSGKTKIDNALRSYVENVWSNATEPEKMAATRYTEGSGGFNRPLRGYEGSWSSFKGPGNVSLNNEGKGTDIKNLTKLINKSKMPKDIWLSRGWSNSKGAASFLEITESSFNKLKTLSSSELSAKFVGKTYKDPAFVSCGSAKGSGFTGALMGNIYVPKGAQALYAEPFSRFNGDSCSSKSTSTLWNGKGKYPLHGEFETILQKGGSYRCTKAYFSNGRLYMDFDLIKQEP